MLEQQLFEYYMLLEYFEDRRNISNGDEATVYQSAITLLSHIITTAKIYLDEHEFYRQRINELALSQEKFDINQAVVLLETLKHDAACEVQLAELRNLLTDMTTLRLDKIIKVHFKWVPDIMEKIATRENLEEFLRKIDDLAERQGYIRSKSLVKLDEFLEDHFKKVLEGNPKKDFTLQYKRHSLSEGDLHTIEHMRDIDESKLYGLSLSESCTF